MKNSSEWSTKKQINGNFEEELQDLEHRQNSAVHTSKSSRGIGVRLGEAICKAMKADNYKEWNKSMDPQIEKKITPSHLGK